MKISLNVSFWQWCARVIFVELESFKIFSSRVMTWSSQSRVTVTVESLRVIALQARVKVESNEISYFFYDFFMLRNGAEHAIKWCPIIRKWCPASYEMAQDKLENGAQCCFSKFDGRLFICKFFQFEFYLSLSLSVISTNLAQPCCMCCNLSVSVVLNVQ